MTLLPLSFFDITDGFLQISWAELRLIRTLERIELMKDAGRWSLRQPKKQRGTGGLTKTHWDYLMDEMVCIVDEHHES
jgi:chromatin modification-related protein VID21